MNFKLSTNPAQVTEPGIGLWLIFSLLQFIFYNILIYLKEAKPFENIDFKSLCGKKPKVADEDDFTNVSFSYFIDIIKIY